MEDLAALIDREATKGEEGNWVRRSELVLPYPNEDIMNSEYSAKDRLGMLLNQLADSYDKFPFYQRQVYLLTHQVKTDRLTDKIPELLRMAMVLANSTKPWLVLLLLSPSPSGWSFLNFPRTVRMFEDAIRNIYELQNSVCPTEPNAFVCAIHLRAMPAFWNLTNGLGYAYASLVKALKEALDSGKRLDDLKIGVDFQSAEDETRQISELAKAVRESPNI